MGVDFYLRADSRSNSYTAPYAENSSREPISITAHRGSSLSAGNNLHAFYRDTQVDQFLPVHGIKIP